ncbi:Pyridoxal-phosphate dependent enzyme family protein [Brugia malayi]|uniref:Bm6003 n=2 Tax=Brugia malayi TaxID=6279 RepID=A0A0K0JLA4_BRUMA|nr:Pyridoxal-phosphate dependent enzyme family protein [Brugia malayi]CDP93774.2 Bm6003 [Brugia malayi]VIO99834.1 Pyridoxal-phosphate dependent enzyme family protein [Brugia malayi]
MLLDMLKLLVSLIVIVHVICVTSFSLLSQAPLDEQKRENLWRRRAIAKLWEERRHMGRTPMFKFTSPGYENVDFVFKNESASRTGSLKHRYSWALIMWAIVDGKIGENTTVYEASSGNTAASEAYMCRLIGVKFIAIVPNSIEQVKVEHIQSYGGDIIKTDLGDRLIRAKQEAIRNNGFFMNQFANSDKAEEYHESGNYPLESVNLMHEVLAQIREDLNQTIEEPNYFVHSAGTGGTISSIGRYVKKYGLRTEVVLADTQFSVYYDYVMNGRFTNESGRDVWVIPGMAGIGFGVMGPVKHGVTSSLLRAVIDRAIKIPDIASTAAMAVLKRLGINGGTSTGANFIAALHLAATHDKASLFNNNSQRLIIATILGDTGDYYESSYYNRTWISENFNVHGGLAVYDCWIKEIEEAFKFGSDPLISGHERCDQANAVNMIDFRSRRTTCCL